MEQRTLPMLELCCGRKRKYLIGKSQALIQYLSLNRCCCHVCANSLIFSSVGEPMWVMVRLCQGALHYGLSHPQRFVRLVKIMAGVLPRTQFVPPKPPKRHCPQRIVRFQSCVPSVVNSVSDHCHCRCQCSFLAIVTLCMILTRGRVIESRARKRKGW